MTRAYWLTVLGLICVLAAARGNWNDTSTGIDLDNVPHFPLAMVGMGPLKDAARVTFDGITATRRPEEVHLTGRAKSGKRWEAHLCVSCMVEVWRADLDRNGIQDYVFFGGGPFFNGRMTPLYSFTILQMDHQGLPVPFFTVAYRGENGEGIKHLVDLDHDGRPELLISTYDEAVSDSRVGPFCSGHWTNQLYRFRNLGVEEIRGVVGGLSFPLVHDWSYRGSQCNEEETPFGPVQAPRILEHGTSRSKEVETSIRGKDRNGRFAVAPVAGCKSIDPRTVVFDRKDVREIAFENLMSEYKFDLMEAILAAGARVQLRGINDDNGLCSVNLMWAAQ